MRIFYDRDDQNRRCRAMARVVNLEEATRKKQRIESAE
jgi:hypothetical protein